MKNDGRCLVVTKYAVKEAGSFGEAVEYLMRIYRGELAYKKDKKMGNTEVMQKRNGVLGGYRWIARIEKCGTRRT